jgi:hypothetical protein
MALASCLARQGQQRSFRRMRQVFSRAMARSPGEPSRAWTRLVSFWEAGLFRRRRQRSPLSASTTRPEAASSRTMPQIRVAVRSSTAPGSGPDTHKISPLGLAMTGRFMP